MELHLQFGWGMMAHTRRLIEDWNGGTVILSPRDLKHAQLVRLAESLRSSGGEVLLDPQCFSHDADHQRLTQHAYWQIYQRYSTGAFFGGPATAELLAALAQLSAEVGATRHLLPGLLAQQVGDDWFTFHESIIEEAPTHFGDGELYATIALSSGVVANEASVEEVVDRASRWDVPGVYLVCETPGAYLVADPNWIANVLILASGLKLAGKRVLLGYCSHQMLLAAAAHVDAIASGTWLNVRAFPPEKFYAASEDAVSRRTVWYYCPQALSEYKIPFLDIAMRMGMLDSMKPSLPLECEYSDALFGGAHPSTVEWGEQDAFRHYLSCLKLQAEASTRPTFDETVAAHLEFLDDAERLLVELQRAGVRGQDRDFMEFIDVNRSALAVFQAARGVVLRREWARL